MAEVSDAVLATASVEGEVLGSASPELEEKLADSPVRLFKPFLSM
jgi:hypothetical protein